MQPLLQTDIHRLLFRRLLHGLQLYKTSSREQCDRFLLENPKESAFVLDHLIQSRRTNSEQSLLTRDELYSESSLLLIAGSDTTATCLAATTFYLLHNPKALARVQEELRQKFNCIEDICSGPKLSTCQFLRACIQESLRMSPPVGGLMAREVLPGGIEIHGHLFPKGVEIGTPHYAIHHDERCYSNPFSYEPERWLANDCSDVGIAQSAFCAFSVGSRGCVGKAMAYHELMLVLGRIMWKFDMRLDDAHRPALGIKNAKGLRGRTEEFQLYDIFASKYDGPWIQVKRRDSGHT